MINTFLLIGKNWIGNAFRSLCFFIDKGIYALAKVVYSVFNYLANATILTDEVTRHMAYRMYAIIGIVMLFVLAFNLLNYIVDPDKIMDKKAGASAFVKDIVLALVIVTISPMLFTKLYSLQNAVLTSGVLENLILGGGTGSGSTVCADYEANGYKTMADCMIKNGANSMVASVYVAFIYPDDDSGFTALDCGQEDKNPDGKYDDYCQAYENAKMTGSINKFEDFVTNDDYTYPMFIPTVAGIVLLFFMLSFCLNLGMRVGKMALIQLVAPVPVTLELLPNKKGLRKTWIDTLIKVYLEVFFFMLVIYIVILLISFIPDTVNNLFSYTLENIGPTKLITVVLLIFGLLKFGKEAPQMLFDLLGIKSTGIVKEAFNRAVAMGSVATNTLGSVGTNAIQNFANTERGENESKWKYLGRRFGSAVAGGTSAGVRNVWAGRNAHNWRDASNNRRTVNNTVQQNRRNRQAYYDAHGNTLGGVLRGHASDFWSDTKENFSSFVHGNFNSSNAEISLLERLSQTTSSAKVDKTKDETYNKFNTAYEELKYKQKDDFKADYEAWKLTAPAGQQEESDFFSYLSTHGGSYRGHNYSDLTNAYNQKAAKEADLIKRNDGKLKVAAAEVNALLGANPQLRDLKEKVTIGGVTQEMSLSEALSKVVNSNGELIGGHEWKDVQNVMDAYNKAIGKRKSTIQAEAAAQRIRDEQRKSRNNNGGGSSGGGSK
ncbi:MAG: hypothetical protein HFG33_05955 [Bacilli bacterium]|nr:hypothetical protein [Bacilli bacterium]